MLVGPEIRTPAILIDRLRIFHMHIVAGTRRVPNDGNHQRSGLKSLRGDEYLLGVLFHAVRIRVGVAGDGHGGEGTRVAGGEVRVDPVVEARFRTRVRENNDGFYAAVAPKVTLNLCRT